MSRVARWKRGPDDPETVRGWLFRFQNGPKTPEGRRQTRILLLVLAAYLAVALLLVAFVPNVGKLMPLINVVFPIVAVLGRKQKKTPALGSGPGESFEVRMTVADRHGVATGTDRGWLIFSEGWLLFEGARTSFAVTRGEARGRLYGIQLSLTLEDRRSVQLSLVEGQESLTQAHRDWNAAPIPEGEALLPPTEFHPETWVDRWSLCIFGAVGFGTVLGFGIAFGVGWVIASSLLAVLACLIVASRCARRLRRELSRVLGLPGTAPHALEGSLADESGGTLRGVF